MTRSERKAKARLDAIAEYRKQLEIEKRFRAIGMNWHRVERELRSRGLKFNDAGLGRLMRDFNVPS